MASWLDRVVKRLARNQGSDTVTDRYRPAGGGFASGGGSPERGIQLFGVDVKREDAGNTFVVRLPGANADLATGVTPADMSISKAGWGKTFAFYDANGALQVLNLELQPPIGCIIWWPHAIAEIPYGWALCDGQAHFGVTTVDMRGLYPVGYKAGDPDYGTIGATLGYTWHGTTENGHPDHDLQHAHWGGDVQAGSGTARTYGGVSEWTGTTSLPATEAPDDAGGDDPHHAHHKGPCHTNLDTDNRPPSRVGAWIQRVF